ncbi:MAG: hypothetical protein WCK78_18705 [Paludibacter sp.]
MLMFENGLLATFIPEFVMVMAYLFCLVVPGLKTEKHSANLTPKIIQTSIVQSTVTSVYIVTKLDFCADNQITETENQYKVHSAFNKQTIFTNHIDILSDGLSKALLSRPPPIV